MPQAIISTLAFIGELIIGAGWADVVGLLATAAIGGAAIVGGSMVLGKMFDVNMPKMDTDASRQRTIKSTKEPFKIVYGEALVSGPVSYVGLTGSDNESMYNVISLAGHEVTSITDIHFDNEIITNAQINSGLNSGSNTNGNVTAGTFGPKGSPATAICVVNKHLGGATQAADPMMVADFSDYTWAHQGKGIAYIATKWTMNEDSAETWNKYAPRDIKALVQGKKVYDPRLEVTAGGTAGASPTNSSYIAYTKNPALCVCDYLMNSSFGLGVAAAKIDWAAIITAADGCDVSVPVPGGTEARFECNGVLFGTDPHRKNITKLLSAMNGNLVYSNGKYVVHAGVHETATETLTEDDLTGAIMVKTSIERSARFNTVKGLFIDPDQNHKSSEFPKAQIADAVSRDNGDELEKEIQLPMTNSSYMAQRISNKLIQQGDQQKVVIFPANLSALRIRVGDRVQVTVSELSWSAKEFQCIGWTFAEEQGVNLTLREDSSTAYADPASNWYSTITATGDIADGFRGIPSCSGLRVESSEGKVFLNWVNPGNPSDYQTIFIYSAVESGSSGTSVAFSSAVKIGETDGTQFVHDSNNAADGIAVGDKRYYWVRAFNFIGTSSEARSNLEPNTDPNTTVYATVLATAVDWDNVANPTIGIGIDSDTISINTGTATTTTGAAVAASGIEAGTTVTQGGITMNQGGSIKGGQSAYDTGTGFFLGYDSAYKFSIGNASGEKLTFNGTDLTVTGDITATSGAIGNWTVSTAIYNGRTALGTGAGMYLGTDGIAIGATAATPEFKVLASGALTATSATIEGAVTATSGTFTGTVNASDGDFTGDVSTDSKFIAGTGDATTVINGGVDPATGPFYRIFSGASSTEAENAPFSVTAGGEVTAKKITILDAQGNVLLDSDTGLGAAALTGLSLTSGAAVDKVSGVLSGESGEITLVLDAISTITITTKLAINDTAGTSLAFYGAGASKAAAESDIVGSTLNVLYNLNTDSAGYSTAATKPITFTSTDTTPAATEVYVQGATYLSTWRTNLMPNGGAIEHIANSSTYGTTAYIVTSHEFTNLAVGTHKFKIGMSVTNGSASPEYSGQTTSNRLFEITAGVNFVETATNSFKNGTTSVPSGGGTVNGDLVVTGDMTVQGTTTTVDSNNLVVKDPNIVLNYSTGDSSSTANNSGITIQDGVAQGSDSNIQWKTASDTFEFSHGVNVASGNFQIGGTNVINSGLALYNLESFKLADAKKAYFGSSNDLEIYHSGSHSYISDVGSGALKLVSNDMRVENTSSRNMLKATGTAVELYHDTGSATTKRLETTSTGATLTGNLKLDSLVNTYYPTHSFLDLDNANGSTGSNSVILGSTGSMDFIVDTNTGSTTDTFTWGRDGINAGAAAYVELMQLANSGNLAVTGEITAPNLSISNWNTAYSWGNPSGVYLPLSGGTLTGTLAMGANAITSTGTISSGAITSTGNSSHGGYSSWTAGSGTGGIFMHYNATNSYRGYFDWRTLQLGNNGANNILAGNTGAGGYFKFWVNATAISQAGGTSGINALTLAATGNATFAGTISSGAITSSQFKGGELGNPQITRNGLTYYVDFNNKACVSGTNAAEVPVDLGPNNYLMSLHGGANFEYKDGIGCYYFDGSDDHIEINNFVVADTSNSIEIWHYAVAQNGWETWWDSGNERPLLGTNGTNLRAYPNNTNFATINTGKWYHVVWAWASDTDLDVFVNGVRVSEAMNWSNAQRTGTFTAWLGGDTTAETTNGYIAIARAYDRQLTTTDVLQNYNAEVGTFATVTPDLGLIQKGGSVTVPSLQVGSTTVIDSSRNLTNIGTISSGAITSTGQIYGNSGQVWSATTQGTSTGSIHLDPNTETNDAGSAITFGASDTSAGANAQAGIYIRSDGAYGTRMYLSTTDSYAAGSKTAISIDHAGNVSLDRGNLQMSGVLLVDQSRNLTNIGTISSGAITSTGLTISGTSNFNSTATFSDGSEARFGASNNMGLFYSSGTSHIRVNSGIFKLRADDMRFTAQNGTTNKLTLASNGDISFYNDSAAQGLFWDSSASSLGIGVTNVGTKLDITTEANKAGLRVTAPNTTNQSFGATIAAGTSASDYALNINNAAGNYTLFKVKGDGSSVFSGAVTANAGVVVDNITIDGTEIDSSSSLLLDIAGNLTINVDGTTITLADDSINFGQFYNNSSGNFNIYSPTSNKDIIFSGNDGGSTITALTLDMSDGGEAYFSKNIHATSAFLTTTNNEPQLTLISTDADASVGPILKLYRNSASPADGDVLGRIQWSGEDDAGNDSTYARIQTIATDVTNGSENAKMEFYVAIDDTFNPSLTLEDTGAATFAGAITANAGVVVDNITIDGTEIDSSSSLLLDIAGNLTINVDGTTITLADDSINFGQFYNNSSGNFNIYSPTSNKDIIFSGNDGGSTITALTLDMSDAGTAIFNNKVVVDTLELAPEGSNDRIKSTGGVLYIKANELSVQNNSGVEFFGTSSAGTVFNNGSADLDFRVESDGNTHMLFVDGGNNSVNIGSSSNIGGMLNIAGSLKTMNSSYKVISSLRPGGWGYSQGAYGVTIIGGDNDTGGTVSIGFDPSVNTNGGFTGYGQEMIFNKDISFYQSNAADDGWVRQIRMEKSTGVIINDNGLDLDFRVESSGNANMLFVDGGNDRVGIGTSSPTEALHVTGNILASGNVTAYSDERLKENIKTLQGSKVLEMRGVSFTKDGEASSGVIAQELESVAPELVLTADDEMGTKSVAYGNLVGYLIEAVKSQQKQIEELSSKIKKLEK